MSSENPPSLNGGDDRGGGDCGGGGHGGGNCGGGHDGGGGGLIMERFRAHYGLIMDSLWTH